MSLRTGGACRIRHHESGTYLTVECDIKEEFALIYYSPLIHSGGNALGQIWYVFGIDTDHCLLVSKKTGLLISPADFLMKEGSPIMQRRLLAKHWCKQTWKIHDDNSRDENTLQTIQSFANLQFLYFNSSDTRTWSTLARVWPSHSFKHQMELWSIEMLDAMTLGFQFPTVLAESFRDKNDIGDIVRMTSWKKSTGIRSEKVLIGKAVIPFPLIDDETVTRMWQSKYSPFYYLSRHGYWEMVFSYINEESTQHESTSHKVMAGFVSNNASDMQRTIGISVDAGPSYGLSGVMEMVRWRLTTGLQLEFKEESQTRSVSVSLAREHYNGKRTKKALWFRQDYFSLRRTDGSLILEWTVSDHTKRRTDSFPNYVFPQ